MSLRRRTGSDARVYGFIPDSARCVDVFASSLIASNCGFKLTPKADTLCDLGAHFSGETMSRRYDLSLRFSPGIRRDHRTHSAALDEVVERLRRRETRRESEFGAHPRSVENPSVREEFSLRRPQTS